MPKKKTVAVLGSFDTWSYMDYVARLVAAEDCIAHTSRFVYAKDPDTGITKRKAFVVPDGELMIDFLRDRLIGKSDVAILVHSVAAGHYNEAHWLAEQNKSTLGIAFVRGVEVTGLMNEPIENCSELKVSPDGSHSACTGGIRDSGWTAWRCIESNTCPFKKQGISLNQIEYFVINNTYMMLFAVESIEVTRKIVSLFLKGSLS